MTETTTTTSKRRLAWLTLKFAFAAYFAFFILKAIGGSIA